MIFNEEDKGFYNREVPTSLEPIFGAWTPVEVKLPEIGEEVLVSFDNGEVEKLWQNWADPNSRGNYPGEPLAYIGGDGYPETAEEWAEMKTYVTAWMPLPKPYGIDED